MLPVLLLLVLGAIDLGRMFSAQIALTNAAREGANYLARNPNDAKINFAGTINAAQNEASLPNIDVPNPYCSPVETDNSCSRLGKAVVNTTAEVELIFGSFLGLGTIELSSTVEMLVQ